MAVRGLVLDAMKFLRTLPDIVFEELVGPLRHQYGASELARVEYAFNSYLGRVSAKPTDARQNPRYFFFPGLPASPYIERRNLEWLDQLEDCTEMMRAEVLSMIANGETFEPFLKLSSASKQDEYVGGYEGHKGAWNAFFFYRHGARYDENCARCTGTAQALGGLPLVTIERHAPEVLFSILEPKSYIAPHHGSTNTRITVHLPLEVPTRAAPEDCSLVVGGVEHPWERGRAVAFDDTFEHSARNLADQRRLVLIMDAWNPALTIPEREAIASLIPVLGSIWG
jgi:aspartate beta-hydroxylase